MTHLCALPSTEGPKGGHYLSPILLCFFSKKIMFVVILSARRLEPSPALVTCAWHRRVVNNGDSSSIQVVLSDGGVTKLKYASAMALLPCIRRLTYMALVTGSYMQLLSHEQGGWSNWIGMFVSTLRVLEPWTELPISFEYGMHTRVYK